MPRTARTTRTPHVIPVTAALLGAVALTACGAEKWGETASSRGGEVAASAPGDAGTPAGTSTPSGAPTPYVEPGAGDGAPHYRENNGHRLPGDMSPASEKAADAQAARVRGVLKGLWKKRTWDPDAVRAALRAELGAGVGAKLGVRSMDARWDGEKNENVTPEGAVVGLRVRDDACVTGFIQKSNFGATSNGPYRETGCFTPPVGH